MNNLYEYSRLYPQMPLEIILFFKMEAKDGKVVNKQVYQFCDYYKTKYSTADFPQPRIVAAICDLLVLNNNLSRLNQAGPDTHNSYLSIIKDNRLETDEAVQFQVNKILSYRIYGFKFIYEDYKKYVRPVEFTNKNDNKTLGTCFLYQGGIATARHCIDGAKNIAIDGFSPDKLKSARFEIHGNELMDLLFIRFDPPLLDTIILGQDAEILDEVMALGFPKIPGYHNFLTAENATVSSRFTASVGQIASNAKDIWIKEKLYLITAKIKGGNSGGPVVAKNGNVIGVAVNLAEGEGDYDELGYGTVIPISFLNELIASQNKVLLDVDKINFKVFE